MGRPLGDASYGNTLQVNLRILHNYFFNFLLRFYSYFRKDFIIFNDINTAPVQVTDNNFSEKILLCRIGPNHFDSVFAKAFIDSTAVCQGKRKLETSRFMFKLLFQIPRFDLRTSVWQSFWNGRY